MDGAFSSELGQGPPNARQVLLQGYSNPKPREARVRMMMPSYTTTIARASLVLKELDYSQYELPLLGPWLIYEGRRGPQSSPCGIMFLGSILFTWGVFSTLTSQLALVFRNFVTGRLLETMNLPGIVSGE